MAEIPFLDLLWEALFGVALNNITPFFEYLLFTAPNNALFGIVMKSFSKHIAYNILSV